MRQSPHLRPRHAFAGSQFGAAAVEFAIVALLFFTLLFGIIEFGRMFYLWNTVQEVTRRAARMAAVTDFNDSLDALRRRALFASTSGPLQLPAGAEITGATIQINYLNAALALASPMPTDPADNMSACADATRTGSCIRFVEVCVAIDGACTQSIRYVPMLGLFPFLAIDIPVSSVVTPAESLGFDISS